MDRPESACPGLCCAAFYWPRTMAHMRKHAKQMHDGEQIRDMLIPLTPKEAKERYARFGGAQRKPSGFQWKYRGHHFTCKHWGEETRLCRIYEDRPTMCRDYPYGQECQHGCGLVCGMPTAERVKIREEQIDNPVEGIRCAEACGEAGVNDQGTLTVSIIGCARCHGGGHEDLEFRRLTFSVPSDDGGPPWTHWAPCPTNGEPILLRSEPSHPKE